MYMSLICKWLNLEPYQPCLPFYMYLHKNKVVFASIMSPIVYVSYAEAPSRAVLMIARVIGLPFNIKEVNICEQFKPSYSLPIFQGDDGFALWDSHATMAYLMAKYAKTDFLYPANAKKRARIDQMLHFESGLILPLLKQIMKRIIFENQKFIRTDVENEVVACYDILESVSMEFEWIAGDTVTIADYSLISSITTLNCIIPVDSRKCPKISTWMEKCEGLPEYGVNKRGLKEVHQLLLNTLEEKNILYIFKANK